MGLQVGRRSAGWGADGELVVEMVVGGGEGSGSGERTGNAMDCDVDSEWEGRWEVIVVVMFGVEGGRGGMIGWWMHRSSVPQLLNRAGQFRKTMVIKCAVQRRQLIPTRLNISTAEAKACAENIAQGLIWV